MAIFPQETNERLRLGIGVSGLDSRGQSGVLVFKEIPVGALVRADVDRPVELNEAPDAVLQGYTFEIAPAPGPFTAGVTFDRSANRVLYASGNGRLQVVQLVPIWAAFGAPEVGSLDQRGKKYHNLQMPGFTGATPNLAEKNKRWLRLRWTGTAAAALPEVLATGDGTKKTFSGVFVHQNIVPGTMVITAVIGGKTVTLRDNGDGRVVGQDTTTANGDSGDGYVDYVAGTYSIVFSAAPDGASPVQATAYERDCTYKPLDVHLTWDALMAM